MKVFAIFTIFVFAVMIPYQAKAMSRPESAATTIEASARTLARGLCTTFIGQYVTNDHAISVRNEIGRRGYHAWIEHLGSYLSGTRTYAVYANLPC